MSLLDHALRTVQFAGALTELTKCFSNSTLVEVGARRALSSMATSMNLKVVTLSPGRVGNSDAAVLTGIATLWALGYPIPPSALCNGGKKIHLPSYPFFGPKWMAPEAVAGMKMHEITEKQQPRFDNINQRAFAVRGKSSPQDVSEVLASFWAELLSHGELDDDSDFFNLGGDSLLMVSLLRKVNQLFGIEVPPRKMISARTLGCQIRVIRELLAVKG